MRSLFIQKMLFGLAITISVFASLNAHAKNIEMNSLHNMNIQVTDERAYDILIPAGDNVTAKVVRDTFDGGCKVSETSSGMAWDISVKLGISTQAEDCVIRIVEDGKSAVVDFYDSASDD